MLSGMYTRHVLLSLTWIRKVVISEATKTTVMRCGGMRRCLFDLMYRAIRPISIYSDAMKAHGYSRRVRFLNIDSKHRGHTERTMNK